MSKTSRGIGTGVAFCALLAIGRLVHAAESESEALARARAANEARDFATSLAIYRDLSQHGSAKATTLLGLPRRSLVLGMTDIPCGDLTC
jgi:hypothetical protein